MTALKELAEKKGLEVKHRAFEGMIKGKKVFYHVIDINDETATGSGSSKKEAESRATQCILSFV